jgi:iron complex outermembrane receptor protein
VRRDTLEEENCTALDSMVRCPSAYTAGSLSVGALVHVLPERVDLKLDLSTASRFPNVDELYLLGSAPSFPVYANGHPELGVETARGSTLTTGLRLDAIETEVSVFGQLIDDYIYFSPELTGNGEPRFDVTIRGTWPSWGYQPIDAVFYGMDGSLSLGPSAVVGVDAQGGVVRAENRRSGEHLIRTPPDHLLLALVGRPPPPGAFETLTLRVAVDLVAAQSRVDPTRDFAPPPPGYALLAAGIDAEIGVRRPVQVGLEATNLLNTAYRDYSSLLRYYADHPGRDVRVRVGMNF